MINEKQTLAIFSLYPNVIHIRGDIAYDNNGVEISYDLNAVNAKVTSDEQTADAHKASAVSKLTALGLSADEINALIG